MKIYEMLWRMWLVCAGWLVLQPCCDMMGGCLILNGRKNWMEGLNDRIVLVLWLKKMASGKNTHPKTNTEPENHPVEKEHHLPNLHLIGFHDIFRGCTLPGDESISHFWEEGKSRKLKARLGLGLCPFPGINIELMEDILPKKYLRYPSNP